MPKHTKADHQKTKLSTKFYEAYAAADRALEQRIVEVHEGSNVDTSNFAVATTVKRVESKKSGLTEGYVSARSAKTFKEQTAEEDRMMVKIIQSTSSTNFAEGVAEVVAGPLFNLLWHHTPIIKTIAKPKLDKEKAAKLFPSQTIGKVEMVSKFIKGFKTLSRSKISDDELLTNDGFHRIIAASILLGDSDIHTGNIGYIEEQTKTGRVIVCAKVDHGRAFLVEYTTAEKILEILDMTLRAFYSTRSINELIDIQKLKQELRTCIDILERSNIDKIIGDRVAILDQQIRIGSNGEIIPLFVSFIQGSNGKTQVQIDRTIYTSWDEYSSIISKRIQTNISSAENLIKFLDLVEELDNLTPAQMSQILKDVIETKSFESAILGKGYTIDGEPAHLADFIRPLRKVWFSQFHIINSCN